MPFSRKFVIFCLGFLCSGSWAMCAPVEPPSSTSSEPSAKRPHKAHRKRSTELPQPPPSVDPRSVHFSSDRQLWNRKSNQIQLFGHAAVSQPGETLTADYISLDLSSRNLEARGNCVLVSPEAVVSGEEIYFNLTTRTGTVIGGRVSNDRFTLRGEQIHRIAPGRFRVSNGSYTTCRDCSASWSFEADDIDLELQGYAYLTDVTFRVKDAPAFWSPYLVVPIKTQRQTGFLFPRISASGIYGATFVLPFFWAISRSTDMTFSAGEYSKMGPRLEWEGRYALTTRSKAIGNFYYVNDRNFIPYNGRYAFSLLQTQELPFQMDAKLFLAEVRDNLYPFQFPRDLVFANGENFLRSSIILSRATPEVSAYVAAIRNRNLTNSAPNNPDAQRTQFDPRTVQEYPTAYVSTNDQFIWGTWLVTGASLGFTSFQRRAGGFDYDTLEVPFGAAPPPNPPPFVPGLDPIRKGNRLIFIPKAYTTFRPNNYVSIVPSAEFRTYYYDFEGLVPNLTRWYLLLQMDVSTQLERVYEFPNDKKTPRMKHIIRPLLRYSLIPTQRAEYNHPFVAQIRNAQNRNIYGYNFDNNDIIPYSFINNGPIYFNPLGNSLAYGLSTQWIRRNGEVDNPHPSYKTVFELTASQAINFLEASPGTRLNPNTSHVFTRFYSTLNADFEKFLATATYYYNPDYTPSQGRNGLTTQMTWIFERALHQRVLTFDRSVNLGFSYLPINNTSYLTTGASYSLNDYILPYGSLSYNFVIRKAAAYRAGLVLQSPSRCWKVIGGVSYVLGNTGTEYTFDLQLNFSGTGFGGLSDITGGGPGVSMGGGAPTTVGAPGVAGGVG